MKYGLLTTALHEICELGAKTVTKYQCRERIDFIRHIDKMYTIAFDVLKGEETEPVQKIVINRCYGGFSLSKEGMKFLDLECDGKNVPSLPRDDPKLVECVEKLGEKANGVCAELRIVEIPIDVEFVIFENCGWEHVAEKHETWGKEI